MAMIKVTTTDECQTSVTLRVEGSLRDGDVGHLIRACSVIPAPGARVVLDLSGVTFMDGAGTDCIRRLRDGGALLTGCHGLVEELLREIDV